MKSKGELPIPVGYMHLQANPSKHQFKLVVIAFLLGALSTMLFSASFGDIFDAYSLLNFRPPFFSKPSLFDEETEFPYRNPADWDVSAGHGRSISYTVNEATWVNIDVSPNGQTLLIDLLGDIYTLPLNGGTASLLRGGVPFDRQARYSPDGTRVIFTSDESGCDNLWVLNLQTGQASQVTNEPYRFVSNAMWAPNSSSVVGVKWYTSERSIPAGEIWSFSVDTIAHEGVRLVGRPSFTNQIGPEEPVFSPDGNYVYFSKNTADASVFEYSKDPNKGIYTIYRYDTKTGAIEAITGGSGGAARPTPSHDGKTLAFVRRTVFNNSLILRDLASGNEKTIWHGLSFDQQASSAPSGVYPGFSWLPNDQEIVIWAKGKLWRINVATEALAQIPFIVNVNLNLADTVRVPVDPSTGDSFTSKVVTSASRSRTSILFNSLGRTFNVPLPTGSPQLVVTDRITSKEFEFGVSASPNGLQGVHVIWNDVDMGYVEIFTLDGSLPPIRITNDIGRYAFPSFSVFGNSLVFSRYGGDTLTGPLNGLAVGIYVVDLIVNSQTGLATGISGAPRYVTSGDRATFASDGASLLVERSLQVAQVFLTTGVPEKTLVTAKYTTRLSVSSDLSLVAFVDFYELYLAPLILGPNGEPLELSSKPGNSTYGLRRLSPNGAECVAWRPEGGIKGLYWTVGVTEYSVVPDDVLTCQADANNDFGLECVKSRTTSVNLAVTTTTDVPKNYLVFDNALLVTMNGDESTGIIPNGRLVVYGDRITALGSRDTVQIPAGAIVIDARGGVVMPGYIDVHSHWSASYGLWVHQSWEFVVNLAFGVTTMHNPSYDTLYGFADAELVRSGLKIGPRIFLTGTIVYGAAGGYRCEIEDLDAARAALRRLKAFGAFSVKSYQQPCRSSRQMVLDAARELDMSVVPEGGMNFYWNLNQIIDGHTTLEHALPVAPLYEDVTELFSRSGTAYTPTLVVSYGGTYAENYWYQHTNVWENERLMRFSPHRDIESRSVQRPKLEDSDYHHFTISRSVKAVHDKGGLVQTGAHGQRQGLGFHWELWSFSQGGMSNYDVLKAGTANGADALGLQNIGRLTVTSLADIIVFPPESSPLDDIRNSEKLQYVLKDGKLYEAATMTQIFPNVVPLPQGPVLNMPEPKQ